MAWTTPTARATGAAITDSIWNVDLVDNLNYLKTERDADNLARPVGEIKIWPTATAPSKFLLCAGQAISRTGYSALFAVIGTTFGAGDGTTTFNVPDLRGRFPLGLDNMGGTSANRETDAAADTIGGSGGAETVTLTAAQLPAHLHPIRQGSASSGGANIGASILRDRSAVGTDVTDIIQNNTGGGGAHANIPPYLAINFIIYAGV
jgi:microcystin-dependent protein